MPLKAVLFDFNGTIINDEAIHQSLIEELLLDENLRPDPSEFRQLCLGRSDRDCLKDLLERRGRMADATTLARLLTKKSRAYLDRLATLPKLPIYPGVEDALYQLRVRQMPLAVVTGALRAEVEWVLDQVGVRSSFGVLVSGEDVATGKPDPEGYRLAIARLREVTGDRTLGPADCLAIEDTYAGIDAAKAAGLQVVGVANSHPFQMMQRRANWAVDYLHQLDFERLERFFAGQERPQDVIVSTA